MSARYQYLMYYEPEIMREKNRFGGDKEAQALISSFPLDGIIIFRGIIELFFIDKLGRYWIMLRISRFIRFFMGIIILSFYFRYHLNGCITLDIDKWFATWSIFFYLSFVETRMEPTLQTVISEIYPLYLKIL